MVMESESGAKRLMRDYGEEFGVICTGFRSFSFSTHTTHFQKNATTLFRTTQHRIRHSEEARAVPQVELVRIARSKRLTVRGQPTIPGSSFAALQHRTARITQLVIVWIGEGLRRRS